VQNTLAPHPIEWDTPFHHHEGLYCQTVVESGLLKVLFTGESPKQLQRYLMDARTMTISKQIFWVYFYGAVCAVWSCIDIVFCPIHILRLMYSVILKYCNMIVSWRAGQGEKCIEGIVTVIYHSDLLIHSKQTSDAILG